jgi:hypothetical protein
MKRITHWQAALAVCLALAVGLGSFWLFHHLAITPATIMAWIHEWNVTETEPEIHRLADYLLLRTVFIDGIFVVVVWGIIGINLWRLLGRTPNSTP